MKKFTLILVAVMTAAAHAGPPLPAIPLNVAQLAPAMRPAPLADAISDYETPGCWRIARIRAAMLMGQMPVTKDAIRKTGCGVGQATEIMLQLAAEGVVMRDGAGGWRLNGGTK